MLQVSRKHESNNINIEAASPVGWLSMKANIRRAKTTIT